MQNVRIQTRALPSWAAIAAGLLTIVAAAVLVLYFSSLAGHTSATTSSASVVTKSAGSELARHGASERGAVAQPVDAGVLRPSGPR